MKGFFKVGPTGRDPSASSWGNWLLSASKAASCNFCLQLLPQFLGFWSFFCDFWGICIYIYICICICICTHVYMSVYIYIYVYICIFPVESSTWVLFIKFPGFPPNQLGASGFIQMYHAWQLRGWPARLLDRLSWLILCWNCISFMAFLQRSCYLFVAKKVAPFVSLSELVVCRKRGAWSHGVWRLFKKMAQTLSDLFTPCYVMFFFTSTGPLLVVIFPPFFWGWNSLYSTELVDGSSVSSWECLKRAI